jgi:hypothetical protein
MPVTTTFLSFTSDQALAMRANQVHLIRWLDALDRTREYRADVEAIPDAERVRQYSEAWCGRFFRPQFDPYRQAGEVKVSAGPAGMDTFDVLRHDYRVQGMRLEVLETVQFTVVRFEIRTLLELAEEDKRRAISRAAAGVLNLPGEFRFPPVIGHGVLFSTRPEANPITLRAWTDRVDGGVRAGRLFFMCYRRLEPAGGRPVFLNGQRWFDGKCWEPLAAAQAR